MVGTLCGLSTEPAYLLIQGVGGYFENFCEGQCPCFLVRVKLVLLSIVVTPTLVFSLILQFPCFRSYRFGLRFEKRLPVVLSRQQHCPI